MHMQQGSALAVLGLPQRGAAPASSRGGRVGAAANLMQLSPAVAQAIARQIAPHLISPNRPSIPRRPGARPNPQARTPLNAPQEAGAIGLGVSSVAVVVHATTVAIAVETNDDMDIFDFIVDSVNGGNFQINDIKIRRMSIIAGAFGMPGSAFFQNSLVPKLEYGFLSAGSQVIVTVTNTHAATDFIFSAMFVGYP